MASHQVQKLETDVHIKAFAKRFHDLYCSRTHHIGNICPDKVQSVEILEGEWGSEGSIICWNHAHDGKACVSKVLLEAIDGENNKITFTVLEGDLLEYYKSFKYKSHVIPQKEGSVVHWTIEYEKLKDHIPDPHTMLQLVTEISKDIDAHLISQGPKVN